LNSSITQQDTDVSGEEEDEIVGGAYGDGTIVSSYDMASMIVYSFGLLVTLSSHSHFRHFLHFDTRSLLMHQGKAMPTKAKLVDVLVSIQDVIKGAQVFEHVKSFTTLMALEPDKLTQKDDNDGFVFVRGHEGASEADSGDGYVVSVSNQVEGESVSRDCLLSSQGLGIHGRHRGLMSMRVQCMRGYSLYPFVQPKALP